MRRVLVAALSMIAVVIGGVPEQAAAADVGVSYWPDVYSSTMFTRSDELPKIEIDFYGVTRDEKFSLWIDDERVDDFSVFASDGSHQTRYWKVGFGRHLFYVKDSDGNILSEGDPGFIRLFHLDLSVTALTNPFSPRRDGKTSLRVCYDVRPNVPSFGYATEAPGRASYVRTNIYVFGAPKHPPQFEGQVPYRSFGATLLGDGTCQIVGRWDGTNDWGAFGDVAGQLESFYTVQAAIRFGPDRTADYQYLKDNDKILIGSVG